jgi:hypothetical protein
MRKHHVSTIINGEPTEFLCEPQLTLAQHALPKGVVEGVTERAGGVPLFVEEVTRLLLEQGEQGRAKAIPPTLQQSLTARLDRLGPAREVAQIGSVDATSPMGLFEPLR